MNQGRPSSGTSDSRLLLAQQRRKQAALDSQLLANRIALLKAEEEKTMKKIQQTKSKASEIQDLRAENERRMTQHMIEVERANRRTAAVTESRQEKTKQIRQKRLQETEEAQLRRRDEVAAARRKKQEIKKALEDERLRAVAKAQKLRDAVKKAEEDTLREKQRMREVQAALNRKLYEDRVAAEEREIRDKEQEMARMEKVEMELIAKLRNTQLMQRQAYQELETALTGTPS